MRRARTWGAIGTIAVLTSAPWLGGCSLQLLQNQGKTGPSARTITLQLVNLTGQPLDPQVYIAPAGGGVEALFAAENQRTDFGVGGLGILLPVADVIIALPCGEGLMIGTKGGIFGEDLTQPTGAGQQYVLREDETIHCGDTVTFTFTARGQSLVTTYVVTPQAD